MCRFGHMSKIGHPRLNSIVIRLNKLPKKFRTYETHHVRTDRKLRIPATNWLIFRFQLRYYLFLCEMLVFGG